MGSLRARCQRASGLAVGLILLAAVGAGLVRVLPWLLAPGVPAEVALPFARALLGTAIEAAVLVGTPIGFAVASAIAVELGEARALHALGASPLRLAVAALPAAVPAALATFLAIGARPSEHPGVFATRLVEQGRASCARRGSPTSALVPMVGVTWLCFPGQTPRVVGRLPGGSSGAWFSATTLTFSDDLRVARLDDLRVASAGSEAQPRLSLEVAHGVLTGLPSWGRPSTIASAARTAMIAGSALLLALLVALFALRGGVQHRARAILLGGAPTIAALSALSAVDRSSAAGVITYLAVPLAGAATALSIALLFGVVDRVRTRVAAT